MCRQHTCSPYSALTEHSHSAKSELSEVPVRVAPSFDSYAHHLSPPELRHGADDHYPCLEADSEAVAPRSVLIEPHSVRLTGEMARSLSGEPDVDLSHMRLPRPVPHPKPIEQTPPVSVTGEDVSAVSVESSGIGVHELPAVPTTSGYVSSALCHHEAEATTSVTEHDRSADGRDRNRPSHPDSEGQSSVEPISSGPSVEGPHKRVIESNVTKDSTVDERSCPKGQCPRCQCDSGEGDYSEVRSMMTW